MLQNWLTADVVKALSQKGFSAIDVYENFVAISVEGARALLATDLAFDASKHIAVRDINGTLNSSFFSFFSAPEIMTLGSKGIKSISFNSNEDLFQVKLGAVQAKALADKGISLGANGFRILAGDGEDLARLSPAQLAKLVSKGTFSFDALDNVLTLSFDQYRALEITNPPNEPMPGWPDAVVFDPYDEVTLELRAAELAGLADAELVKMAGRGIDVLSVKETGSALSSLTVQ